MKQRARNREHWGVGEMTLGQRPEASEEEPARQREQPVSARALRWELERSDWGWGVLGSQVRQNNGGPCEASRFYPESGGRSAAG